MLSRRPVAASGRTTAVRSARSVLSRPILRVAKPGVDLPELHGPIATESWAEEVCDIHAEPGHGKEYAVKCAIALDLVAEDQHKHPKGHPDMPGCALPKPGRCTGTQDEECEGP
ncbi:hypothetical protein FOA52_012726 [Chlamydomonas sp. UWO 241]|nr:hypothetical protein FOA52_012726 [Chlamydomonas sp. UWO 241]